MALNYEHLMGLKRTGDRYAYGDRESMLYALGIGLGRDPLDERELAFVFEQPGLKTVPTMASVLARVPLLRDCGFDYSKVLHGEQRLQLHRPLPPAGELVADSRVTAAYDKGAGKGAVIYTETAVRGAADGAPLFTVGSTTFARGDGGFGGPAGSGPEPHALPARKADAVATLETRADQALLYRLNGDRNPLHADPALARRVGFRAPILHGLCTYGVACHAVIRTVLGYDASRIAEFDVRFSAPVYPGESIAVDLWVDGDVVSFRCRVPSREDAVVINHGRCRLNA
ncbi:MAG: MaoC/PaaZ C-terminal domain-containing protein [Burkholderiales bacterium]